MKVTKAIKKYIEHQLTDKLNAHIAELKTKADESVASYEPKFEAFRQKITEEVKAFAEKNSITLPKDYKLSLYHIDPMWLPEYEAYSKAKTYSYETISRAVTEVVTELELEASKADVIKVLEKMQF